jgi:hypothetical protein
MDTITFSNFIATLGITALGTSIAGAIVTLIVNTRQLRLYKQEEQNYIKQAKHIETRMDILESKVDFITALYQQSNDHLFKHLNENTNITEK